MMLEKGNSWWKEYGDFPPEDERERAPSPSAVLESYRLAANVDMPTLAEELAISVRMVRRIFHQGDGLDSIQRRRVLASRLEVPPELLGLDCLHGNTQERCWWVDEGYHAFSRGDDRYPHAGEVVRWHRKQMRKRDLDGKLIPWRQEDLGDACVPSLSGETVNKMERHNIGLDSITRRRALVSLLGIPPALLGLDAATHERAIPQIPRPILLLPGRLTDDILLGFEQHQEELINEYFMSHGQGTVGEMNWWISYLQDSVLPLAQNDQQRGHVRTIEWQYHRLLNSIAREQCDYGEALLRANASLAIAEEMEDREFLLIALFLRANTYRSQGPLFYKMALADTDRGLMLIKQSVQDHRTIDPSVSGLLTLEAGTIQNFTAQDKDDRSAARALHRRSENLTQQALVQYDTHRLKQDLGYYHLGAAMALTVSYNPVMFGAHLDEADHLTSPTFQRRHLIINILRAQGEMLSAKHSSGLARDEHYAEATRLATDAFDVAQKLNSRLNRQRIQEIYHELKNSPYSGEPTVAHLGLLLELWP